MRELRCNKAVRFCVFLSVRFTHMTEALHLLKNFVDVWHHVLALNHDGSVGAVPQSHMEHSAALHIHRTQVNKTHTQHCGIDPLLLAAYTVGDQLINEF